MEVFNAIWYAIVALFILVTVHEFGHYWVARKCGVRVERFSIGFGKPFARFTRDGTEFALAPIPLGGYVKMFGEGQGEPIAPEDEKYSFSHKTVWQRMAIVLAGPIANFILAVLFYWMVFAGGMVGYLPLVGDVRPDSPAAQAGFPQGAQETPLEIISVDGVEVDTWREVFDRLLTRVGETGQIQMAVRPHGSAQAPRDFQIPISRWQGNTETPEFLSSLGLQPYSPELEAVVGEVVAGSPAEAAGLMTGDRVLRVDGMQVESWEAWRSYVSARPGSSIAMEVERQGRRLQLDITPEATELDGQTLGRVGVVAAAADWPEELKRPVQYSALGALVRGAEQTYATTGLILDSLKKLITGQISTKSLGGPISIAKFAGTSAEAGWQSFFTFVAGLSVMLGVVNLLPIPVLDGGHFLFYVIEAIKGSPLDEWVQGIAVRLGMVVLLSVMLLALYNDFGRL